jgi:hypothetical protein
MHQEASCRFLLIVMQVFDVGQLGGVIHDDVHFLIAGTPRTAVTADSDDPMAHPLKQDSCYC